MAQVAVVESSARVLKLKVRDNRGQIHAGAFHGVDSASAFWTSVVVVDHQMPKSTSL